MNTYCLVCKKHKILLKNVKNKGRLMTKSSVWK